MRDLTAANGPSVLLSPCHGQGCQQPLTSVQHQGLEQSEPRTLLERARQLASTVGQSSWSLGESSLAEDLTGSPVPTELFDSPVDQFSGTSDVIGGLRSPELPALQDEGSGMIWNGKGVAPIIKSVP